MEVRRRPGSLWSGVRPVWSSLIALAPIALAFRFGRAFFDQPDAPDRKLLYTPVAAFRAGYPG